MDVKLVSEAVNDRENLSDKDWNIIKSKIDEVTASMTHEDLKLVPNPFLDHAVWQLTVNEEDLDYRVYIDVDKSSMIILAIWDFEFTHNGDNHWRELTDRM
jgi:hypothetical protein